MEGSSTFDLLYLAVTCNALFCPPTLSPDGGGGVLATSSKTPKARISLSAPTLVARGVGMVVEGACLLAVLIGFLGHRGMGLVVVLNKAPEAAGHEFDPPAEQCGSQASPSLQEKMDLWVPGSMSKNWECISAS